jgi:hypothetical protein
MIKILAAVPLAYDATSYYRAFGIFPDLKKQVDNLFIDSYTGFGGRRYTWAELMPYDILFMQRPAHPDWLALAKYCKNLGIKIWVDYDDNLFNLPPYNRVSDTYTDKIKKTMFDILTVADEVTVSTPAIQEYFHQMGISSDVIPNALNIQVTPMATEYNWEGTKMIPSIQTVEQFVWRGSETHLYDFLYHQEQIVEAMTKRPNTFWSFLGFNPSFITMTQPATKWKYFIPEDVMIYIDNMRKLKPSVMHVPLVDDGLNQCKSNIAWIEATACGAVTIGPNWPEWQRPGIINYSSFDEYGSMLMRPLDDARERWGASRDYIMENLTLTHVNKQRAKIIEILMD